MDGVLKTRDGKLYVVYSSNDYSRPNRTTLWWRVVKTTANPYNANRPQAGDKAVSRSGGEWSTSGVNGSTGSVSIGSGSTNAEFREESEVLPPSVGDKQLRWQYGQWEKLTSKGWVPAGETKEKAGKARGKKTAALDREIAHFVADKNGK
jgi:hypothetical protein